MNFKEYYNSQQSELINEDLRTRLSNLISGIFGRKVAIDVNSYPNQYILPPSGYVKLMEMLQKDTVNYWEQVNGQTPPTGKSPYFSYQMKDVNGKASKIQSEKFPIWGDVKNIATGTSFYLQSKRKLAAFLKPFSTNGTFKKLAATTRGGDIVIFDLVIKDDPQQSKLWYPTIPGQEDKFEDVQKTDNQFVLICTNAGSKHIINLLGFPIPQYIKIESMKKLDYTKATGMGLKTADNIHKRLKELIDVAQKAAKSTEGEEEPTNDELKSAMTNPVKSGEAKKPEDAAKAGEEKKPAANDSNKVVVGQGVKFAMDKSVFDKLKPMLERKNIGFRRFIDRLFNESVDISKLTEIEDSDNNPLYIDGSNLPKIKLSTILKSKRFGFDDVKVEGNIATDNQVIYRIKKNGKDGYIGFVNGDKPYIIADENGKKWFREGETDNKGNVDTSKVIYNSPEWLGKVDPATTEAPEVDLNDLSTQNKDETTPAAGEEKKDDVAPEEKPAEAGAEATPEEKPTEEIPEGESKFEKEIGEIDPKKLDAAMDAFGGKDLFKEYGTIPKEAIDKFLNFGNKVNIEESAIHSNINKIWTPKMILEILSIIKDKNVGYIIRTHKDPKVVSSYENAKTPEDKKKIIYDNLPEIGVTIISKKDNDNYVVYANEKSIEDFLVMNYNVFDKTGKPGD